MATVLSVPKVPPEANREQLTVVARRVLLDALQALEAHLEGVTVVGAQAVYLRTPESAFTVASYTLDADLALRPTSVAHPPAIDQVMEDEGFRVADPDQPGTWTRDEQVGELVVPIPIDLLVPESIAGRGRRSAKLPEPHDKRTARRVPGIEAVLFDRDVMAVPSLQPAEDARVLAVYVAGVASLLVAKAHKISDRLRVVDRKPDRLTDKDASDVVRIFMAADPLQVRQRLDELEAIPEIADVVRLGRLALVDQFGDEGAPGSRMAVRALEGVMEAPDELAAAWVGELT